MKYYLGFWKSNWADEMDVEGFKVFNEEEYELIVSKIEKFKNEYEVDSSDEDYEISFLIGSNEDMCYDSKDDLISEISFEEISKEEYDSNKKRFGHSFGFDNVFDYIEDCIKKVKDYPIFKGIEAEKNNGQKRSLEDLDDLITKKKKITIKKTKRS